MARRIAPDPLIGRRAWEEFDRVRIVHGMTIMEAVKTLEVASCTPYGWLKGSAPNARHLQGLSKLGADVTYIVTGVRVHD